MTDVSSPCNVSTLVALYAELETLMAPESIVGLLAAAKEGLSSDINLNGDALTLKIRDTLGNAMKCTESLEDKNKRRIATDFNIKALQSLLLERAATFYALYVSRNEDIYLDHAQRNAAQSLALGPTPAREIDGKVAEIISSGLQEPGSFAERAIQRLHSHYLPKLQAA
jgi:hypothetical protein